MTKYSDQTLFADQDENVFDGAVLEETGVFDAREIEKLGQNRTDASDRAVSKLLIENDGAGSVENQAAEIFGGDIEALPDGDGEHETARSDRDDEERAESDGSSVKDPDKPESPEGLIDAEGQPVETHSQAPKAPLRNRIVSTFGSKKKERIVDSESNGPKTDLPDDEAGERKSQPLLMNG